MERWLGRELPNALKNAKVWGCAAWPKKFPTDKLGKFEARSDEMHMFVGIDRQRRCFRLCKLNPYKIVLSAHAVFVEDSFPCEQTNKQTDKQTAAPINTQILDRDADEDIDEGQPFFNPNPRPRRGFTPSDAFLRNLPDQDQPPGESKVAHNTHTHPAHVWDEMKVEDEDAVAYLTEVPSYIFTASESGPITPSTHPEAMSLPVTDAKEWRQVEINEFHSHKKNATFSGPVKLPPGFKAIPTAWVYKIKRCGRKKARVVLRGYLMKAGIDYNETFAPVPRISTIRMLISTAIKLDWDIVCADGETAFLNPKMDTEVYITLPPAFNDDPSLNPDGRNSKTFHRLLKGVPGIKQGSHLWNVEAHTALTNHDFSRAFDEYCLYVHNSKPIYVVVWVDDFFFFHPIALRQEMKKLALDLKGVLDLRIIENNEDELDIVGLKVKRDRANKRAILHQRPAIKALLKKVGMDECNPETTPLAAKTIFTRADCPSEREQIEQQSESKQYRSVVASLLYFSRWTRLDISFAISKLSKFMSNPGRRHLFYLKRVLRYLKGTLNRCLVYDFAGQVPRSGVYGYYDAAHADDIDTRRSTMAYLFFFEGCPISWKSKLHSFVTLSTNNSEYCASAKAAREAKWLWKMYRTLKFADAVSPIDLFSDSTGAIAMNHNPVQHEANKHCDLADHFAREQVERGIITISHVSTQNMLADLLTKSLGPNDFTRLVGQIMKDIDF